MNEIVSEVPTDVQSLLAELHRAEEGTNGRLNLTPAQAHLRRNWLSRILLEGRALGRHIQLLQEFYSARFRPALPRWLCRGEAPPGPRTDPAVGFRHYELLPEDRALAVAERGLETLTDDEIAALLLNPYALSDLSDLINTLMPSSWLDLLSAVGRELIARHGLEIRIPGENEQVPSAPGNSGGSPGT